MLHGCKDLLCDYDDFMKHMNDVLILENDEQVLEQCAKEPTDDDLWNTPVYEKYKEDEILIDIFLK